MFTEPVTTDLVREVWSSARAWEYEPKSMADPDVPAEELASIAFTEWLGDEKAAVWDEAVQALAWAIDHGPEPLAYVAANNPYSIQK